MYEYFEGTCKIANQSFTIGVDKVDVTSMADELKTYKYGNIQCDYADKNFLNCDECYILQQNNIKRDEPFH